MAGFKIKVLVAPLDWGLGHATRCVPIIKALLKANADVVLAGNDAAKKIFKTEFPSLKFLDLKGYEIKYGKTSSGFLTKMLLQAPKLSLATKDENKRLKEIISKEKIDAVISDNRLGFYSDSIPCVFITHQLNIKTGIAAIDKLVRKINYSFINKFNECWIPDYEGENNLSGGLSHGDNKPKTIVTYIGPLSRLQKSQCLEEERLFITLSGPEPQRTIFENIIFSQVKDINIPTTIVRGLPNGTDEILLPNKLVEVYNHLPSDEFNKMLSGAKYVIARGGYSTIMDLAIIQKKALLVPTPGQTEQEYLCGYLSGKKYFLTQAQNEFNLIQAVNALKNKGLKRFEERNDLLQEMINNWLLKLK